MSAKSSYSEDRPDAQSSRPESRYSGKAVAKDRSNKAIFHAKV
jgi:hypothetical protein